MERKIVSFLICMLPILSFAERIEVDGLFYNVYPGSINAEVTESPNKYSGDIVIPETFSYRGKLFKVTTIGEDAFRLCDNLYSVVMPNSVIQIERRAFCDSENLKTIHLSSNLTSIKQEAFNGCKKLIEISLPQKLSSIDVNAFAYCESLSSLNIPPNVVSIESGAFKNCYNLKSISVDKANTVYDSRNDCNAVIITSWNTLIIGCSNTIIPEDIVIIGDLAFCGCKELKDIKIPEGVEEIKRGAFTWSGLRSITIPNTVTRIGEYAFQSCNYISSFTIPESVTNIGKVAFSGCDSLRTVTILGKDTYIADGAFASCPSLSDVYLLSPYKLYIGENTFESYSSPMTLHVQKEVLDDYKSDNKWKYTFDDIITIGSENHSISTYLIFGITVSVILMLLVFYKIRGKNNNQKVIIN